MKPSFAMFVVIACLIVGLAREAEAQTFELSLEAWISSYEPDYVDRMIEARSYKADTNSATSEIVLAGSNPGYKTTLHVPLIARYLHELGPGEAFVSARWLHLNGGTIEADYNRLSNALVGAGGYAWAGTEYDSRELDVGYFTGSKQSPFRILLSVGRRSNHFQYDFAASEIGINGSTTYLLRERESRDWTVTGIHYGIGLWYHWMPGVYLFFDARYMPRRTVGVDVLNEVTVGGLSSVSGISYTALGYEPSYSLGVHSKSVGLEFEVETGSLTVAIREEVFDTRYQNFLPLFQVTTVYAGAARRSGYEFLPEGQRLSDWNAYRGDVRTTTTAITIGFTLSMDLAPGDENSEG